MQDEQTDIHGLKHFGFTLRMVVVGCFALVIFVRFYQLGLSDYWLDELHSMSNSAGLRDVMESIPYGEIVHQWPNFIELTPQSNWSSVIHTMKHDSHPPLYFLGLQTWRKMWGDQETAVRFLSAIFSVLSILPMAMIFRELKRHHLIPWVVLGMGLCYSHIHMGQENRPYSLGILWVSISFWMLIRMERHAQDTSKRNTPNKTEPDKTEPQALACAGKQELFFAQRFKLSDVRIQWIHAGIYASAIWLAMMTHYFTALALLGQVVYALMRFRGSLLKTWLTSVIMAAAIWWVLWGSTFLAQREFISNQNWLYEKSSDHVEHTLYRVTDLPVRLMFNHERFTFINWRSMLGVGLLVACCVFLWRRRSSATWLFSLWYFVPLIIFLAIDFFGDRKLLAHIRYVSIAGPGMVGIIVVAIDQASRHVRKFVPVILLLIIGLSLPFPTTINPESLSTAEHVKEKIDPDDIIIYDAITWPRDWIPQFFMPISYYLTDVENSFVLLRDPPDENLKKQLLSYPRLIVISPRLDVVPNPLPGKYSLDLKSSYIEQVGWVYIFSRIS